MHKQTLYITFDGLSDPLGQSQILPYICGIAKTGYHINILSCEKKDRLDKEKEQIEEVIKNLPISWTYILYNQQDGFLSRLIYLKKLTKLAKSLISEKSISLIHCRSYLAALIGLKFKRKLQIPFLFDMRGFWADERIDGGIWKKTNLLHNLFYKYFKYKEKKFMQHSDAIISLTHSGLNELDKKLPNYSVKLKTTIIPCCTNTNVFTKNKEITSFIIPGINPSDHVIIYTGSIGTWYFTKELINCVLTWKKKIPNIKLLIVTKDIKELNDVLSDYSNEDKEIVIQASSSYQDVPKYLSVAKAAMFFIKPSYSKMASSPTKMAECWAMNLPIITNVGIGDNDLFFNKYMGGILIPYFSTDEYEKSCESYLKLAEKSDYRNIALTHFDTQGAVLKYVDLYNRLTS